MIAVASLIISAVSAFGFLLAGLAAWNQRNTMRALQARIDTHLKQGDPMTPQPEPTPFPTPPANWSNIPDVVTFLVAAAFFILGILTSAGVVLPAHTAADVSLWAGIAQQAAAVVASVVVVLSRHSVQKTAIRAGLVK